MPGGSTFPWLVMADVEGVSTPFVVKIYKSEHLKHDIYMKECISSVLAKEFEILTPDSAFITFNRDFFKTIDSAQFNQLKASGLNRTKYATRLIEPITPFSVSLRYNPIDETDIEYIYAFDNLILHRDRDIHKPNIFLSGNKYYLIDHEAILTVTNSAKNDFLNTNWTYNYNTHIFYKMLRRRRDKSQIFDKNK
jgi:hypothetical protein